jgi:FkbM family methyltransferase
VIQTKHLIKPVQSVRPIGTPRKTTRAEKKTPEMNAAEARKLLGKDDATILEIGSNDGTDSKEFLDAFKNIQLHCFECDPRAISKWRSNIADRRASLYEVALAKEPGQRTFHQSAGKPPGKQWEGHDDQWDKSGSLLPVNKHTEHCPWLRFDKTITVECTTLDSWADNRIPNKVIDFIWIDVQGAEAEVLRGGQKTIARTKWWYCEIDPRQNYHGEGTLDDIRALLPGFSLVREYAGYNYLWKNDSL